MMKTLTAFLALIAMLLSGCERASHAQPAAATPPANEVWITQKQAEETSITTTPVAMRPVPSTLAATGRVTFSDARVSHVFSAVTGRVTNVLVSLGENVRRGATLAVIESPDLASAVADREKGEADLSAAERDYQRQKELYEAHAAAQRDFEAAESSYRKARAERDRAAQKAAMLGTGHAYLLRAPIDGEIVARSLTVGMEVQGQYSGGSTPELFTIGNLDRVCVLADVYEIDLPRIKTGAPVSIRVVAYPDREFTGRVDWISGALDPATRTVKVRCTIDNTGHLLRPEMYATISLTTDTHAKLAIPRSAVVRVGDEMVTFVDKGVTANGARRFERRPVSVDETEAGDIVPVMKGLQAGESVVSSGAIMLTGSPS